MRQLKKVLKNLDIYGNIIGFKYEDEDRIKSVLGGCLTIILLMISVIVLIIRFVDWSSNDYNLSIKTSSFYKNLTYADSYNSSLFGFKLGVLKQHKDGSPTTFGDLNPIGESSINHVALSGVPYLHEKQKKIGNIINCYENENYEMTAAFIKFQDSSFKDSYKSFLCSNVSKYTNISIGSDFIRSEQSEYLESNLFFNTCKLSPKCKDNDALNTDVFNEFRLFLSITNQFFDKNAYNGFKSTYSSYIYHRLNLNKDLNIDVVVTKNIVITDPNKLFTFSPIYYKEFYSYRPTIIETNRKVGLNSETTLMNVKIVFREYDQEVIIYRNFETIENIVADIATILFAIYFVFKLLLFFFKKGNLTLSLLNKIYKFKEEDDSKIDFETFNSVLGIGTMIEKNKLGSQDNKQVKQVKKDNQVKKDIQESISYPKKENDLSLANLNQRNESQQDNPQGHSQDNPLRIEFKLKGSSELPKKDKDNETTKDKSNNSVLNYSTADSNILKSKTKREVDDSKKDMIELQSINKAKNQDSMIEIDHEHCPCHEHKHDHEHCPCHEYEHDHEHCPCHENEHDHVHYHEHDQEKKLLHGLEYLNENSKNEKYFTRLVIPKTNLFFYICFGQCYRRKSIAANYYYVGSVFLNYDLSIETFLKKAIEYETLKKLLLTDNQRKKLVDHQRRRISKDNFANTLNEMRSLTEYHEAGISIL